MFPVLQDAGSGRMLNASAQEQGPASWASAPLKSGMQARLTEQLRMGFVEA